MLETLTKAFIWLTGQLPGVIVGALLTYYFARRQQQAALREDRFRAGRSLVALTRGLIKEFAFLREELDRAETGNYLVNYLARAGAEGEPTFLSKRLRDPLLQAREQASRFDQGALGHWEEVHLAIEKAELKFKTAKNNVELESPREAPAYRESINRVLKCLFAFLHAMRSQCGPDTQADIDLLLIDEGKG